MRHWLIPVVLILFLPLAAIGQTFVVSGVVQNAGTEESIGSVTIFIEGTGINTASDRNGSFRLETDITGIFTLRFSRLGYLDQSLRLNPSTDNLNDLVINLSPAESDLGVTISESRVEETQMIRETTEAMKLLPSTTGNLESVLPHIALGARSGTGGELSSQYNVRGGNYDENLVYVNDFEIFRPQLLRSSQQEGLTFPNIDLIRDLSFSSGGFQPKYGDKMSSVLDVRYKRPTDFKGSISGSLLGGSAHLEGSKQLGRSDYQKLRYLIGARYKTTKYLLGSLDVEGEYSPNFADVQAYLTYDLSENWQIGLMGNYNESEYNFVPKSRATALGLIDFALMLTSVFEGAESDLFRTGMLGGSLTFIPDRQKNPLFVKLLASTYRGLEIESLDISGFYRLSQVESDIGSENVGEEVAVLGIGTQQQFARNRLDNRISNVELKGGIELQSQSSADKTNFLQWGMKVQHEIFNDRLNEWERIDSAGYSLPFSETEVLLNSVLKSRNDIQSTKVTGYVQNTYTALTENVSELKVTLGTRLSHWNLTGETNLSPRAELLYKPLDWDKDISFKLAGGIYYQTPIYRELRRLDGTINRDLKSQRSFHLVAGITNEFYWRNISDKPFKFIAEAYYKNLSNLITYDIDNVRIRYTGENDASGNAMGLDLRLNGEFVPGAESWLNVSFLRVRESLDGVEHVRIDPSTGQTNPVSSVPRPTDQFFNLSLYFQDYLPKNENIKVNLNMVFGTGLPFGVPENNVTFRNVFRHKAYRRVDMGFSFHLWNEAKKIKNTNSIFRGLDNAWLSLEVFNLIGIENVSSNTWVKTVFNQQFAVPNNLTTRRINLKLRLEF